MSPQPDDPPWQPLAAPAAPARRHFLQWLAAAAALASGACSRQPEDEILPYVQPPLAPAGMQPLYFATATDPRGDGAIGLLVQSIGGRPTKIEGNPGHPASLGGTDAFAQASVLDLWDPDRSRQVLERGAASGWPDFAQALQARLGPIATAGGKGLAVLTEPPRSPTLARQLAQLRHKWPAARVYSHLPIDDRHARAGSRLAFGRVLQSWPHLDRCRVVLALDDDLLARGARNPRDFARGRRGPDGRPDPGRLYVAEPTPTLTGARADHRLALGRGEIGHLAFALAAALGLPVTAARPATAAPAGWIDACADDLRRHRGACLVTVGAGQPPAVHALAHAINQALGNLGHTLSLAPPPAWEDPVPDPIEALVASIDAGRVQLLLILGGNPAYTAPVELDLARRLAQVPWTAHLATHDDETSARCHWHLPQAHYLESWSDATACDGTVSVQQPLIAPLYEGRSAHHVLALLLGDDGASDHDRVRASWQARRGPGADEAAWNRALQSGVLEPAPAELAPLALAPGVPASLAPPAPTDPTAVELVFAPDPASWDGRYANNPWLQELPRPFTRLTWDNAALLAPSFARQLGVADGDLLELELGGRRLTAPALVVPGQARASVTLTLGGGRTRAGRIGNGVGYDAYPLRSGASPWLAAGLKVRVAGGRRALALTQHHEQMEGRDPVRSMELARAPRDKPDEAPAPSIYEATAAGQYAWAMSIDLDACTGCGVCTLACQAENNIPVVGRDQVARGRVMHWIRVDHYVAGEDEAPLHLHQPVPCMHCEHAPCEAVCPVEATVHDSDGLNLQVYNRCIGTRFCSNNCPYKVRRFNFLQYADDQTESLKAQRNPEVTVRMRGVMEKCTYCVQRITTARVEADRLGRRLRDGEVLTACQAACPTGAITFGDLLDAASAVRRERDSPLAYTLLEELGTRPRTTYRVQLTHRRPGLAGSVA